MKYFRQRIALTDRDLSAWQGRRSGSELLLTGRCPVCAHETDATIRLQSTSLESITVQTAHPLTVAVECSCEKGHTDQQGATGCGRRWTLRTEVQPDGTLTFGLPDDPRLEDAAEAWQQESAGQLARLRAAAEKWIAGVAALLGVAGIFGLGLAADDIRKLTDPGKASVAIVALIAVLSAAAAIVLSYRAAYGLPQTTTIADDDDLRTWYADRVSMPNRVGRFLRDAVVASAASVLAFLTAIGLTWFLPPAEAGHRTVSVTLLDGSAACGTLLSSAGDGQIRLRRKDSGTVQTIPLTTVARVEVRDCP